jgi:hypothetical protein
LHAATVQAVPALFIPSTELLFFKVGEFRDSLTLENIFNFNNYLFLTPLPITPPPGMMHRPALFMDVIWDSIIVELLFILLTIVENIVNFNGYFIFKIIL